MAKQKQKQTQIVNINLGSKARKKKGKGKAKPKKSNRESKTQITPAIIPPSIINYPPQFVAPNQPNWFRPPPVSQSNREYAVIPELETGGVLGLNPYEPVKLKIERAEQVLKPPPAEPKLSEIAERPTVDLPVENLPEEKAGEEIVLPPAEPPSFEEDISLLGGGTLGELPNPPPSDYTPTITPREEQFRRNLEANRVEGFNPPYIASSFGVPLAGEGFFPVAQSSQALFAPAELSRLPTEPSLAPTSISSFSLAESLAQPKEEPKKRSQKKKTASSAGSQAGTIHSFFPSLTEAQPVQVNLATGIPTEFPPPPLFPSRDKRPTPFNVVLEPISFIGQSKPASEKHKELISTLERQRGVGITPAEESILFA